MKGKVLQWDYDFIKSKDNVDTIAVCFTYRERQILLSMLDYIGWSTRWFSPTDQTIDQDDIDAWRDSIGKKLMFGDCPVDCDEVWYCILPTGESIPDDLLSWLIGQLGSNGDVINIINNPPASSTPPAIVDEPIYTNCDSDYLYGFILQLVKFINTAIENSYERFEAATNTLEAYQAISEEIPIMTEVTDFVAYLQDTIVEEYLAAYDTAYENEVSCDLFCLARRPGNECTLTWNELYEYFLARLGAGLANKDILDLLQFILGGGWNGTEFADASFAAFCGIMYYAGEWTGLTLPLIQKYWTSFTNDPNSDWETLCDECAWQVDYTYPDSQIDDWSIIYGVYDGTHHWIASEDDPGVHETAKVERTFSPAFDGLKEVWCDGCKIQTSGNHDGYGVYFHVVHGGGTYDVQWVGDPDGANAKAIMPSTFNGVTYITIEVREDSVGDGGFTRHMGISLLGAGDNPPPETIYE